MAKLGTEEWLDLIHSALGDIGSALNRIAAVMEAEHADREREKKNAEDFRGEIY